MKKLVLSLFLLVIILTGCDKPNSKPTYGDTGLPKNCRAIVTSIMNEYRTIHHQNTEFLIENAHKEHYNDLWDKVDFYKNQLDKIDEQFQSLDRNCGEFGYSWEYD